MQVARQVKSIFQGLDPGADAGRVPALVTALERFAEMLGPWAGAVAARMLADVDARNMRTWREHGLEIGRSLRAELAAAPTGHAFRELLAGQVGLIKSLPLDAARGVHEMVQEGMFASTRSADIAKRIAAQSDVPRWRARLIARTEVSRASVTLTQVRAQAIGSDGYIWRTVRDADVRDTHREMEGKYVRWDSPPKTDKSLDPYHAGCGPNCRCYPEPVLPDY